MNIDEMAFSLLCDLAEERVVVNVAMAVARVSFSKREEEKSSLSPKPILPEVKTDSLLFCARNKWQVVKIQSCVK